jgi:hypothetical protein
MGNYLHFFLKSLKNVIHKIAIYPFNNEKFSNVEMFIYSLTCFSLICDVFFYGFVEKLQCEISSFLTRMAFPHDICIRTKGCKNALMLLFIPKTSPNVVSFFYFPQIEKKGKRNNLKIQKVRIV